MGVEFNCLWYFSRPFFEITIRDFKILWLPIMKEKEIIPFERIEKRIYLIRNRKVMLSTDLAALYETEPRALIQAVKRNIERFPDDFMFQLSVEEFETLKSQYVTSKRGGMRRATPYAFTEQGVAMLSSVLKSKRAIEVNIQIMRTFVKLRQLISTHAELLRKVEEMEKKYDKQFLIVFDAIKKMMTPQRPKKIIGFKMDE
jgi:hypothetical protein